MSTYFLYKGVPYRLFPRIAFPSHVLLIIWVDSMIFLLFFDTIKAIKIGVVRMKACGLIVEYNPFHNGHLHHLQEARKITGADCMITVMSGPFLQRGEPAIMDKFHRAKAALASGIDIVLELPFIYAVESSDLFAKGSVATLNEIGVSSICFGSESGDISAFLSGCQILKNQEDQFKTTLKKYLDIGFSFPEASKEAYKKIGLVGEAMDLSKPNNILGFSYVKEIVDNILPIKPYTIKRTKSNYHDQTIQYRIASATSIRNELFKEMEMTEKVKHALPENTLEQLQVYRKNSGHWHSWEDYFPLLHYRVMTMAESELRAIHGVEEGLEYRIKRTAKIAESFHEWVDAIKTKRYTWTRLQRTFVHILANTKKSDLELPKHMNSVPYVRILGMTKTGREFLHARKKIMNVPVVTRFSRNMHPLLELEERASHAYYSILKPAVQQTFVRQELEPPIFD